MSRPEPKFSVNQPVMIRCYKHPENNTDFCIVTGRFYKTFQFTHNEDFITAWGYTTDRQLEPGYFLEKSLRPIPKEKPNGIDALEWIKDLRGVEA